MFLTKSFFVLITLQDDKIINTVRYCKSGNMGVIPSTPATMLTTSPTVNKMLRPQPGVLPISYTQPCKLAGLQ